MTVDKKGLIGLDKIIDVLVRYDGTRRRRQTPSNEMLTKQHWRRTHESQVNKSINHSENNQGENRSG